MTGVASAESTPWGIKHLSHLYMHKISRFWNQTVATSTRFWRGGKRIYRAHICQRQWTKRTDAAHWRWHWCRPLSQSNKLGVWDRMKVTDKSAAYMRQNGHTSEYRCWTLYTVSSSCTTLTMYTTWGCEFEDVVCLSEDDSSALI